jgi:hypothetical protein
MGDLTRNPMMGALLLRGMLGGGGGAWNGQQSPFWSGQPPGGIGQLLQMLGMGGGGMGGMGMPQGGLGGYQAPMGGGLAAIGGQAANPQVLPTGVPVGNYNAKVTSGDPVAIWKDRVTANNAALLASYQQKGASPQVIAQLQKRNADMLAKGPSKQELENIAQSMQANQQFAAGSQGQQGLFNAPSAYQAWATPAGMSQYDFWNKSFQGTPYQQFPNPWAPPSTPQAAPAAKGKQPAGKMPNPGFVNPYASYEDQGHPYGK